MTKRTFVKLCNLLDWTDENETAEQALAWKNNVLRSVGVSAYSFAEEDYCNVTKELGTDEIEFVDVACYGVMGSAYEAERFYEMDWVTVKEKATGDIYALETEGIYDL
jgi:hypothetical protein